ncbi:MAG: hypothetical protein A3D24_02825 [Candidatus Blackburnbacteria bacterium RIFCSPHIGHO2_02_FULL_39_13]|uniref:Hemerythrin-like domain-containing protein n=1 Tax=Candidatus Blackburnbacteria bacterium RIFCSPLOWO2_01_FULL_40_20 TaxID=1797519 RepID=A0A1G1VBT2_9BACT|nr:MAG: hypothetical protein A2694_01730 [Candidatus Blackburnbacteria bacterium RIFCSPHIGHO2_01_FULL_40_17]OGY07757.1 MAG: hypothetical protein A3D24_02825 [Candidatus Blackburnbacteria bacterium RIFCSPHIGHO2_02_FULL_39_13]OGY12816.1 MAG: hypothetical protein A3A77_02990 [Candidatus Blackburnbacteria bacterium RIFCSPLOWO2_01_FULL_40_20]
MYKNIKITDILRGEHGVFRAQLAHLEKSVLGSNDLPNIKSQMAMFGAGLIPHANMEDKLLFTKLDPVFGKMGPVSVMRAEHKEIEGAFEKLPKTDKLNKAKDFVLNTIQVAKEHFGKEEQMLFAMAEEVLSEKVLFSLGERWLEKRGVFF